METQAILSSCGEFTSFSYGGRTIRFRTSPTLERYTQVRKWDNGYIVVMAKYSVFPTEIEEYIDLIPILENLYMEPEGFLKPIENVRVSYD